jgi:hypothetical protein
MATATSGSSSAIALGLTENDHVGLLHDPCYVYAVDQIPKSASATLTLAESGTLIPVSATATLTLPAISVVGAGVRYRFRPTTTGIVITIDPNASDKIVGGGKYDTADVTDGGALTWTVAHDDEFIEILSGTDWNIQAVHAFSWVVV